MVGQRIKETRHRNNLTQEELAEGIISRTYLSLIEKGSVQPSTNVLIKLSERLNCSLNDLMSETSNFRYNDVEVFREIVYHEYKVEHDDFTTIKGLISKEYDKTDDISVADKGRLHLLYAKYYRHMSENDKMHFHTEESILSLSNNVINQFYIDAVLLKSGYLIEAGQIKQALDILEETYLLVFQMSDLKLGRLKLLFEIIECYYRMEQYFTCRRLLDKFTYLKEGMRVDYRQDEYLFLFSKVAVQQQDFELLNSLVNMTDSSRMTLLKCFNLYKKDQIKDAVKLFKGYHKNTDELKVDPLMNDIYHELEGRIGSL